MSRSKSLSMSSISMSGGDAGAVPADAVGKEVVHRLMKALARQVGPFAKVFLKQELTKLGATPRTLVRDQYSDLVQILGRRISDEGQREAFSAEASRLLPP